MRIYIYIYTSIREWGALDFNVFFFLQIVFVQLTVSTVVYRGQAETYPTLAMPYRHYFGYVHTVCVGLRQDDQAQRPEQDAVAKRMSAFS